MSTTQQINKRKRESDDLTITPFDWSGCPELEAFALECKDIDIAQVVLDEIEKEEKEEIRLINAIDDKLTYLRNRKIVLVTELEQLYVNRSERYESCLNSINKIEILCKYYTTLRDFKKIPYMSTNNLHRFINEFITKSPFTHQRITKTARHNAFKSYNAVLKSYGKIITKYYFNKYINRGIIYTFSTNKYEYKTNVIVECTNKLNGMFVINIYLYQACFTHLFNVFYVNKKVLSNLFEDNVNEIDTD